MIINDTMINASCEEIVSELQRQLAVNNIPYLQKSQDSGKNIMIQCPYHGNGQERRPSAGIRKIDGLFHCFRAGTKVITREYGAIEIQHLVHTNVHILNGDGEWEKVCFSNYGKQPLMKITLSCNTKEKIIYATPEHEWLIKRGSHKYQTQDLKPNMYLEKCIPKKLCDAELDPKGIVHGFCYGDGNNYSKTYKTYYNRCYFYNEQDSELKQYFTDAQFKRGVAGNGKEYDYVLFKSNRDLKQVPSLNESDSYLLGFLAGYFAADGNCFNNKLTIYSHKYEDLYRIQQICTKLGIMSTEIGVSNISKGQRGCIVVKEDTKGYTLRLVRNTIPDKFFITNKGRQSYQKYTGRNSYKVISVEPTDLVEDVYCCMTSTHSFALEHFILTGNCFACHQAHTLPEVISYCFGKEDAFGRWGMKWLVKNFNSVEIEHRHLDIDIQRGKKKEQIELTYVSEEELDSYRYYHKYWTERGITDDDIIELFDLGYDKRTNEIIMPNYNKDGKCVFVARRSIIGKRFSYPKNVKKIVYGIYQLYQLEKFPKEVYITESMIDCIYLWQFGRYACALNGLGTKSQFDELCKMPCRKFILATDNDEAGMKARAVLRNNIKNKLITEVVLPANKKDINECTKDEILNLQEVFCL